ncbi:hypothetical protein KY495_19485 [Massilia sp. PAMC28688]|uniref:pilus assembly PilX family protein n=1 Tax=Massilia sp. PAMC28688 TaxID=2861283 RepID=UPI001C628107|nr:hypothetical protein [Massilia sp. PAMC28688]QYF92871.1 hypothetical protein KY495_19485 [Massilia sp. PAMC28688]
MKTQLPRQAGVALPIMLLMVLTMAITSIYLIKSVNSAAINATNAAYESALVRAADLGLHEGYKWLHEKSKVNKAALNTPKPADGYTSSFVPTLVPSDTAFWTNSKKVTSAQGEEVEYVIHRMCSLNGPFDQTKPNPNSCVMTSEADIPPRVLPPGESIIQDNGMFKSAPQVHYIISSRLSGPRGGSVVNQMVVLIGV